MNGPSELVRLIDQRIRAANMTTRAIGTCVTRDTTGPGASVLFDGATVAVPVKVLGHVVLRPEMRCTLDKYGSEWLVTGAFAVPQLGTAEVFTFGVVATTTSASYVNWGSSDTWTFRKFHDSTVIEFDASTSAYAQTAVARGRWAIQMTQTEGETAFSPTDLGGPAVRYDTVNVRTYASNRWRTPGNGSPTAVPAGTYTCRWRWQRTSGTGTLTTDTSDMFSLTMDERVTSASPYV